MNLRFIHKLPYSRIIWRPFLAGVLVLAFSRPGSGVEDGLPGCVSAVPAKATIVRVVDSQTVETAKGVLVKLAALNAPSAGVVIKGQRNMGLVRRAGKLLTQLVLNKPVSLVFDANTPDRYGRMVAHVFVSPSGKSANTWVQAKMIGQGLARVFPNTKDATCIKQLLEIEEAARFKKTGLWESRFYTVVQADDLKILNRSLGRLQLVEGRVNSVSVRRTRTYINFSKDWGRDFTVTLSPRIFKMFTQSGINIKELAGKNIRVRGWLDRHNGPAIKVYHMAQIEVLKD